MKHSAPPTAERVRTLLRFEPATGEFIWRERSEDEFGSFREFRRWNSRHANTRAGTADSYGYRQIRIDGRLCLAHRLAWLYVHGQWPEGELDHANRDRSDNRIDNLRPATRSQNTINKDFGGDLSKRGIHPVRRSAGFAYRALIQRDGKRVHLGYFPSASAAAAAYNRAAREADPEFAILNPLGVPHEF